MRYWIYWNDLIQGPFELEELTGLKAFSEDLPVCMEDRTEWMPACRVADLSSAIEALRSRARPPAPPPPPPSGPPRQEPLQGEFFTSSANQDWLFPGPGSQDGPFTADVAADRLFDTLPPAYTNPFRFQAAGAAIAMAPARAVEDPVRTSNVAVLEPPAPEPEPEAVFTPPPTPPVIKQSPVPQEEPTVVPPPARSAAIPLELLPDAPIEPQPVSEPPLSVPDLTSDAFRETPLFNPALLRSLAIVTAALLVAGAVFYWWFDRSTSRSAIRAAKPHLAPAKSIPLPPSPAVRPPEPAKPTAARPAPAPISRPPVLPVTAAVKRPKVQPAAKPVSRPSPALSAKPVVQPASQAAVPRPAESRPKALPGVSLTPKAAPAEAPAVLTAPTAPKPAEPDLWIGRHNDAIVLVTQHRVSGGKETVQARAKVMLEQMHDRELLHAAETGQRLYLPDKMTWSALREEGSRYRVYLGFSALQANGERAQARAYQFRTDLARKAVDSDDAAAQEDFLKSTAPIQSKRDPKAVDIESLLAAVDLLNKHKMNAIILKSGRRHKQEVRKMEDAIAAATLKLQRALAYFKTRYPEPTLANVARAYEFTAATK